MDFWEAYSDDAWWWSMQTILDNHHLRYNPLLDPELFPSRPTPVVFPHLPGPGPNLSTLKRYPVGFK